MSKTLADISLLPLLPHSIRDDEQMRAAALALDGPLAGVVRAVPRLLLLARLNPDTAALPPPLARLADAAGGLEPLPLDVLEHLAWQYHIDFREAAATSEDLAEMVRTSFSWHRIKGTPASVEQALALFGVDALVDESGRGDQWAVYELELREVPRGRALGDIIRAVERTAPARCRLRRLHGEHDRRPIVLDVGPALDDGYLDDDSGVWDDSGLKLSFGSTWRGQVESWSNQGLAALGKAESAWAGGRVFRIDKPILDNWRLDAPTVRNHGFVSAVVISTQSNDTSDRARAIAWHRALSRSQLVLDDGCLDASVQRLDRKRAILVDRPQRLDASRLDESQSALGIRTLWLDELLHAARPLDLPTHAASAPVLADRYLSGLSAVRSEADIGIGAIVYRPSLDGLLAVRRLWTDALGGGWHGPWAGGRYWRPMIAFNQTTEEIEI